MISCVKYWQVEKSEEGGQGFETLLETHLTHQKLQPSRVFFGES